MVSTASAVTTAEPVSFTTVEACLGLSFVFLGGFVVFLLLFLGTGAVRHVPSADPSMPAQPSNPHNLSILSGGGRPRV